MAIDLNALYQQHLGRDINPQEFAALNPMIGQHGLNDFDLSQIIQGMPDAQAYRNKNSQAELGRMLGANDDEILGKAANAAAVNARQRGVSDSSSIGAATLSAGQGLAMQRQNALAQFYQGNQSQLQQNYMNMGQEARGFNNQYRLMNRQFDLDRESFNLSQDAQRDSENRQSKDYLGKYGMQLGAGLFGAAANGLSFGLGSKLGK